MRDVRLTYLVSFFFCLVSAVVLAVEERAKFDVLRLHPTQSLVGQREVLWRKGELRSLLAKSPEAVKKFLKKEPGEVIQGPANSLWLVDGHHHAKALAELKKEDEHFKSFDYYADVIEDWSGLSQRDFELALRRGTKGRPYVYLKDAAGQTISFSSLPADINHLIDYPLRTVVWLLRKSGAIKKVDDYPFQEFAIGHSLFSFVEVKSPGDDDAYLAATRAALEILKDAAPEEYPGLQSYAAGDIDSMVRLAEEHLDTFNFDHHLQQ